MVSWALGVSRIAWCVFSKNMCPAPLSGRETPVVVWEPAPDFDARVRSELVRLWNAFDSGDRSALDAIEQICLTQDNDAALAAFACRLREAGPGGAFKLKEK